jgi:C-terminal processing protease CtpA/Prc
VEYDFEERVWRGPLLVLMDEGTGSAAAQFAAVLQDNKAAVLLGTPGRGGCGHTDGGTPTPLTHTGGSLDVPDCARFRLDGSNEMMGIDPDVLIGFRPTDGQRRKALRVAGMLPQGIAMALRQCRSSSCQEVQPGTAQPVAPSPH